MNSCGLLLLAGALTFPIDAPRDDATKKGLAQFQGTWAAAAVLNVDGLPLPADDLAHVRLDVDGNKFTLKGKDFSIAGRFTIDPTRTPPTIDVEFDRKSGAEPLKVLGIYRVDGDTRMSCFSIPDKERPAAFPESPKGYIQFEWKRPARK